METTVSPPESTSNVSTNVDPIELSATNNNTNDTTTNAAVSYVPSDPLETEPISEPHEPQNQPLPGSQPGPSPQKKRRRRRKIFTDMISTSASRLRVLRPHPKQTTAYSHSETELPDSPSYQHHRKRKSPPDLDKEVDIEALIAISVGFPVDSLTEEEIEANVVSQIGGVEQANYIIVRNHILARWRSNVSLWLTKDHALESIRAEHKNLVNSAYNFLLHHGYINFGVAPAIKEVKMKPVDGMPKGSVIVIGAGLSGLAAARQLIFLGFKVVVLEGRARPGGRVRTKKMTGGDSKTLAAADLGGSVLTGINGNPLGVLVRQLGFPLHKVRDICPLYLPNGRMVNSDVDSKVEVSFNELLDKVCKLRQGIMEEVKSVDVSLGTALEAFRSVYKVAEDSMERMLLDWHLANLEYANATLMSNLSMAFWDQDDPYEMGGDHCFIPGGNERLVRALAEDLPIFSDRPVDRVIYGNDGVLVHAGGQEYRGDMVLCTVPLGVLKRGVIQFVPELPQRKQDAIERLGFGLLNKVAILFPYDFWGGEIDTFGHLTEEPNMRGEFFLFYSYSSVAGGPLLVALVAGEAAVKFENMSPVESVSRVLEILKGIFSPKGIAVPDPLQAVCTRWGQDQFSYGSYSYVAIGASGDDYDILAESVADRVFFAGEATNKQYPATMHGAFLSGMREAAHINRVVKRRSMPSPEKLNNINQESSDLDILFETPDLAFGKFSVLYDPRSADLESNALLRVAFQGDKLNSDFLYLYGLVQRKQVIELNKVEEDLSRIKMLNCDFQVRLVGRNDLCNAAECIITCIKSGRLSST
ncbi:lysine-specific histone demethylase 1 homolog 1 [Olea europaea subsp. europaea]|uniref:Lysine-specific histone demethylase 1 homolog 1 n=1 Tax=Olea europaea subsp. europaea TaxID=158383 RepID=A0A8S0QUG2_OLEEU|nr:lysine-specific histone demethylase 1 homolog 1 [Olea europaea subsp. europaea]